MRNLHHLIVLGMLFSASLVSQQISLTEPSMKNHTVVEKPALMIVGISCRTSNAKEAAPHDIPKLWQRFYQENVLEKIPNKASSEVYSLYCDYEGDYTKPYSVVIGCEVDSIEAIPEGMVAKVLPAGAYAVYTARGEHPQALIETWGAIWQDSHLKRTYTGDFELYGKNFFSKNPQEVEVYIGIEN